MKKELKKIDVLSLAKIQGVGLLIFGFILGILNYSVTKGLIVQEPGINAAQPLNLGAWVILLFPLFYGIVGFIAGILTAFVYNAVAKKIGGIKIEIE